MSVLEGLRVPIVLAPLAGGPSTPRLAAAVSETGALGFLAAGYLEAAQVEADLIEMRQLTDRDFGVNVFAVPGQPAERHVVRTYAASLANDAERLGVSLGAARFDDDHLADKIELLCRLPVPVVSFTFGLPSRDVVQRLRAVGSEIWLTVTSPHEALAADELEPDALIVQGTEAGGHRGFHVDDDTGSDLTLLAALQLVGAQVGGPLVAAGGLTTGASVAAVLAAGAAAAQLGTAYLRCPEAGTSNVHRAAVASSTSTVLTRAFSGRLARGVRNRFHDDHGLDAPRAYPDVHHLTAPLRAHGRSTDNAEIVNLWAGQTHQLTTDEPRRHPDAAPRRGGQPRARRRRLPPPAGTTQ